jgi:hypothetical protein
MAAYRTEGEVMSEPWVDGSLESGADDEQPVAKNSGQETGALLGQDEASSFEPEEDDPAGGMAG